MEALTRSTGLQRGALYHHIGSKEELLHEVVHRAIQRLLELSMVDNDRPAREQLKELSRTLMVDIAAHQDEWTVFFREIGYLTGQRRADIFALREQYEQRWVDVVQRGVASGEFRPVHPLVVKGILGMHNYSYLWLRPTGGMDAAAIADLFSTVLLDGLVPDNQHTQPVATPARETPLCQALVRQAPDRE